MLWLILRQSGRLAIIGTAIGVALAIGASILLESLLIGLSPIDPAAFATAIVVLAMVMVAASIVPARRATRVDPMIALRAE